MYKKHRQRKITKNKGDKNIFDHAIDIGSMALKAHEKGGMSLLLAFIGIVSLVFTVFLVLINSSQILSIIFVSITVSLFVFSIYLHLNKKKEFCPKCGKELIKKKSKSGESFFACPGYPECKFTKSLY